LLLIAAVWEDEFMPDAPAVASLSHMTSLADALVSWFPDGQRVLVAYSGGADSALVLAGAARAVGPGLVTGATAVSDSLAAGELSRARAVAEAFGVGHRVLATREMDVDGYRANGADRCYFCKATLLDDLLSLARQGDFGLIVTGTNADDVRGGFRPGIRAARERGVRSPLDEVGMTKNDVRALSRWWGLPTWDKPATPCLASRIAYGIAITPARLRRVDAAETAVRQLLVHAGWPPRDLRVRDLGERVRIEAELAVLEFMRDPAVREQISGILSGCGLAAAGMSIEPFASGSLNRDLATTAVPAPPSGQATTGACGPAEVRPTPTDQALSLTWDRPRG
jgi:pyridinium-3,5-biscarboxylic acid mononucleotide sulfurtransferase